MKITSGWHIHSHNSCDEAALLFSGFIVSAAGLDLENLGVTDHLHTPTNLPNIVASREEYLAAVREHNKMVEINISANLPNPSYPETFGLQYLKYLALL
ncbi:MAG: hypothetical protein ACUVX8_09030 [Candidatus Zipacnadales bacterium]